MHKCFSEEIAINHLLAVRRNAVEASSSSKWRSQPEDFEKYRKDSEISMNIRTRTQGKVGHHLCSLTTATRDAKL